MQGVWFRDSTRREAERLGVTGYAINRDNGDVEVLACGAPDSLDALCEWLRQGPPLAKVTDLEQTAADYQDLDGFTTG